MADSLQDRLQKFQIGQEVGISGGMGDWDEGVVLGVDISVRYQVMTEYGTVWHVDADKLFPLTQEHKDLGKDTES